MGTVTTMMAEFNMLESLKRLFKGSADKPVHTGIRTDIHSHLLPGIDDGVESFEEAISLIRQFEILGYRKIITTPHVMQDYYRNTPEEIQSLARQLRDKLKATGCSIELEAAAEYYLDEGLMEKVDKEGALLTFGENYLLFETSFIDKPIYMDEFIFNCTSRGIQPVLAHPERYAYIHHQPDLLTDLQSRGVLLQINANSISGYYSREVRKFTRKLIDEGLVNFIGSDCHSEKHMNVLKKTLTDPYFTKACSLPLLNSSC